jgi:hypothetical protein
MHISHLRVKTTLYSVSSIIWFQGTSRLQLQLCIQGIWYTYLVSTQPCQQCHARRIGLDFPMPNSKLSESLTYARMGHPMYIEKWEAIYKTSLNHKMQHPLHAPKNEVLGKGLQHPRWSPRAFERCLVPHANEIWKGRAVKNNKDNHHNHRSCVVGHINQQLARSLSYFAH